MDVDDEDVDRGTGLPGQLEVQRTRIIVGPEINYHVNTATSAMTYMSVGYDNSWDHDEWTKDFKIEVVSVKHDTAVFELINIDPSIVNSLRRILIAEVPSVAIENVFVVDYDCVVPEEVISHRLGLIPLAVDAEKLEERNEEKADHTNTVVFKLHAACRKRQDGTLENDKVYSRHLKWLPSGSEYPAETGAMFGQQQAAALDAKPIDGDILIAKLRPGQYIELEAHAVKGIGADHAKFSPVGTAWHRLYPEIAVLQDVPEELAAELAEIVPAVFSVKAATKKSKNRLHVNNIREHEFHEAVVKDTITQDKFKEYLELRKRKEHHIFTVESTNSIPAATLFTRAIRLLQEKSKNLRNML